ncbi:hypothetical protein PBR20603_04285 [Pandoraea bronchicola]|uniref:Uncharacterized protein n=1 Tax=Pandoraea bronchicola TaxID=2508287 RepID=A0A5E5C161_9BURK|nr:hypothetical protein PBR20603_04285 [Pandoraea bronchicola]
MTSFENLELPAIQSAHRNLSANRPYISASGIRVFVDDLEVFNDKAKALAGFPSIVLFIDGEITKKVLGHVGFLSFRRIKSESVDGT